MKNLEGKKLKVLSISRKGMFDESAIAFCCDNCARVIVNYAEVTDGQKNYIIGMECKNTLIDKPILSELLKEVPEWQHKYKTKDFNRDINEVSKFLLESSRDGVEIDVDYKMNWISVSDPTQKNQFGMMGVTTYSQNIGFLEKMGLKEYIRKIYIKN